MTSTTATAQKECMFLINGINRGADALATGDIVSANEEFTTALKLVRTSLRQWQLRKEQTAETAGQSPSEESNNAVAHDASGIQVSPCFVDASKYDAALCLRSFGNQGSAAYLFCRKVSLRQRQQRPLVDLDLDIQSPESTLHCLSGILVYNIALLYHIRGAIKLGESESFALSEQDAEDLEEEAMEFLERAKQLYINADRLLLGGNVQDQYQDVSRLLGVWTNLAHLHMLQADECNAIQCSQRVLLILSQLQDCVEANNDEALAASLDSSTIDDAVAMFYGNASAVMMGVGCNAAAAAA